MKEAFDLRGDFLTDEVEELRFLSTLTERAGALEAEERFFIFLPELLTEHLDPLQQGQFKYMNPAKPKIKTPKATSILRLLRRVTSSSLSKLMAKAEVAEAATIVKNALRLDISIIDRLKFKLITGELWIGWVSKSARLSCCYGRHGDISLYTGRYS